MKEKQSIQWSASGQISKTKNFWPIAAEAVLDAVVVLLFLLSARAMLYDVFGWEKMSGSLCAGIALAVICVSTVLRLSEQSKGNSVYLVRGVIHLGGLLEFVIYYFFGTEQKVVIGTGLGEIFHQFVGFWNQYYGKSILTPGGIVENIPTALNFYLLLMAFVLFWVAKIWDKRFILGVLPVSVFVAELLVGHTPKIGGLLFFAVGMILSNVSCFKLPEFQRFPGKKGASGTFGNISWLPILLAAVLVGNLVVRVASPYADAMVTGSWDIRKTIRQWIGVPKGENPNGLENPEGSGNDRFVVHLTNERPEYQHILMIALTMESPAERNVYLKELSAGKYVNGSWETDIESFESYFREKGYDPAVVAKEVFTREVTALAKAYGVEKLADSPSGMGMNIDYLANQKGKMAVPYFADLDINGDIRIVGESFYTRVNDLPGISAVVWDHTNRYEENLPSFEDLKNLLNGCGYDDYVQEHYLDVPDGMENVKSLAALFNTLASKPFEGSENEHRLYKANRVAKWLEENTEYSLDLPALPEGKDAIEFFLGESRQGYCMHYASTSVMVLREMGVPARLATGYVAEKGDFVKTDAEYLAQIKDNQSHAWVEIYLDGLGWFPVEVTKGYRSAGIGTTPNGGSAVAPTEPTEPDSTEPTEEPTEPEPTNPTEEPTDPLQTNPTDPAEDSQSPTVDGGGDPSGSIDRKESARWAVTIVGAGLLAATGIVLVLRRKRNYREALWALIRRQRTSLAIRMMNRRIYRKLRATGKILHAHIRDDGYEEILKKNYPDIPAESWERYMVLVKAAAFSKQGFTDEEVAFCYEIYRKVKPHS